MPVVRKLCRGMEAPAAVPHIFAGVSSILKSIRETGTPPDVNVSAVIVMLFIMVTTRLSGAQTTPEQYQRVRQEAVLAVKNDCGQDGAETDWDESSVDDCMRQMKEYGWQKMDWFSNIELGSGIDQGSPVALSTTQDNGIDDDCVVPVGMSVLENVDASVEDFLQPGLGTMLDEKLDFLSDAHNHSFEQWKAKALRRLDMSEAKI